LPHDMADDAVLDASAMVDLLLGGDLGEALRARLEGRRLHAPAHLDAEVLSALGRLHRGGNLEADEVNEMLGRVAGAPIKRHPLAESLRGAWARRHDLRLADALYVELAQSLNLRLVTTDRRLASAAGIDVVAT
jgi:predicted nucleic acid-binding protein